MDSCSTCLEFSPSKPTEVKQGLSTKILSFKPLDWVVADIGERTTKTGVKQRFLAIADRYSGYVSCFFLRGTKTSQIVSALDSYCQLYSGPPYHITTDGGPQFKASNKEIGGWAKENGVTHTLASAYSPQSNGEAEAAVKRIKEIVRHAERAGENLQSAIANHNAIQ